MSFFDALILSKSRKRGKETKTAIISPKNALSLYFAKGRFITPFPSIKAPIKNIKGTELDLFKKTPLFL